MYLVKCLLFLAIFIQKYNARRDYHKACTLKELFKYLSPRLNSNCFENKWKILMVYRTRVCWFGFILRLFPKMGLEVPYIQKASSRKCFKIELVFIN